MKTRILIVLSMLAVAAACSFSTANMTSLKTSKDIDGKQETSSYKAGDTIYSNAVIANSPGKVTVKFALHAEEMPGTKKGDILPGSEVKVDLPSSGTATYSLPIPASFQGGKFTLTADMLDDKGEKKDGKSVALTIEKGAAPAAPADTEDSDSKD